MKKGWSFTRIDENIEFVGRKDTLVYVYLFPDLYNTDFMFVKINWKIDLGCCQDRFEDRGSS